MRSVNVFLLSFKKYGLGPCKFSYECEGFEGSDKAYCNMDYDGDWGYCEACGDKTDAKTSFSSFRVV